MLQKETFPQKSLIVKRFFASNYWFISRTTASITCTTWNLDVLRSFRSTRRVLNEPFWIYGMYFTMD